MVAVQDQRVSGSKIKTCPDAVMVEDKEVQEGEPVAADIPLQQLRQRAPKSPSFEGTIQSSPASTLERLQKKTNQ